MNVLGATKHVIVTARMLGLAILIQMIVSAHAEG
jgi:hypothetical protein